MAELEMKVNVLPYLDADECPRIEVLNIQPGDILVLKVDKPLSASHYENIAEYMTKAFPGIKVTILEAGMELQVVRP